MNCSSCNRVIQEITFKLNGGLCGPCKKGAIVCGACGKTVFNHPKTGNPPYYCNSCSSKLRREARPAEVASNGNIDWLRIENDLVTAAEMLLIEVGKKFPGEVFYGLIIELGQNWVFELHLNTEAGIAQGIPEFRKGSRGYEAKSDDEIAAMLGRWYFGIWKYQMLSFSVGGMLKNLNQENYDFFEAAFGEAKSDEESEAVLSGFKGASVAAAKRLSNSEVVQELNRTQDFAVQVVDDDGLEYFTKKRL